jgi:hypothetical protein
MCARILALLEQEEISHLVNASLGQSGHEIVPIRTFSRAVVELQKAHFDLIICEAHLENGGSVFDFLRWVKTNPLTNEIPFVVFSTRPTPMGKYLEDGVRTTARILGAAQFIAMNLFSASHFRRQIDALLIQTDEAITTEAICPNNTAKEIGESYDG